MSGNGLLFIPVENQVRELDPKLLLACVAARRGFSSIIGSRRELEMRIDGFPRGIYLSKSMTIRSLLFFKIANRLGHKIVSWDEEALVHLPPETYYSRRLNPQAIRFISQLFAWGIDNMTLWREYPAMPGQTPIHAVGNPRSDMLRPELHEFYREEIDSIQQSHGKFVLVNTNFNHINAFGPDLNLFKPARKPGEKPAFGRAARGMSLTYAKGLESHKRAVFESFKEMIPRLSKAFPNCTVVIRPHPTENHNVYKKIAAGNDRIQVTNEGNVVPWLQAAEAVVHNGCTTGVEAFVLGVPAISYRASVNDTYDDGFYRLPNRISHQCYSFDELKDTLQRILDGRLGPADGDERQALISRYLAGRNGSLACEHMMNVLEPMQTELSRVDSPKWRARIQRWAISKGLHLARWVQPKLPGSHNRPEFQRHRYPHIPVDVIQQKLKRFQSLLGDERPLQVSELSDVIFKVHPGE
jgi:surface carbohydrate biosynthesis protein